MMISDIEHLFLCLLVIYMSSLEKYLFRSSVHFSTKFFVFMMLSYMSSLYNIFWVLNSSWISWLQIFFYHSLGGLFILLIVTLTVQKLCMNSLIRFHLLLFPLPEHHSQNISIVRPVIFILLKLTVFTYLYLLLEFLQFQVLHLRF